jgi:predicted amidohydrolase
MKNFIAAGVQMAITPMDIAKNIEKGCDWLKRSVDETGAELVVFPESVTTGFTPNVKGEALWNLIDTIPGRTTEKVQKVAADLRIHLVWSTYERGAQPGVVYNSAVLIGPSGDVIGVYRKTHPFPTERLEGGGWTTPGSQAEVYRTELANIGMILCYDGDFPELCRVLALKGAEVIVRPSALLRSFEIWDLTNKARAYDNHVYMIGVNAVGPDAGNNYYFGNSMIVDPIAQKLAQARGAEDIMWARLSADPIKKLSYGVLAPMIFDHLEDRNLTAYEGIMTAGKSQFTPAKRIAYNR